MLQSRVEAYRWIALGAERLPAGAARNAAGQDLARLAAAMTATELSEAKRLARD